MKAAARSAQNSNAIRYWALNALFCYGCLSGFGQLPDQTPVTDWRGGPSIKGNAFIPLPQPSAAMFPFHLDLAINPQSSALVMSQIWWK